MQQLTHSFDLISRYYSSDLKNAILYLFSKPSTTKSIDDFVTMIAPFILQEINSTQL
jgi:PAB-dependent poly(A)-specific ribonuclease subunit 3